MSDLKNRVKNRQCCWQKLFQQLKKLSKETMIPMSRLLDRGIELVLDEYKKPTSK